MEMSGRIHAPAALPLGKKEPSASWIWRWVRPRAELDVLEKKKCIFSAGIGTQGPQAVTIHYTDYTIMAPVLGKISFENVTFVSHCDECQAYNFPVCDTVYFGRQIFLETNYTASRPRRSQSYHNHNNRKVIVPLNAIRTSNLTKLFWIQFGNLLQRPTGSNFFPLKKCSLYSDVSLTIWSVTNSQLTLWTSLCIYFTINGAPSMLSGHVANNRLADCVILVACAFYPMKDLLLQWEISAFGRIHISVCGQSSLHSTVTFRGAFFKNLTR
jgi:hypothetical protein